MDLFIVSSFQSPFIFRITAAGGFCFTGRPGGCYNDRDMSNRQEKIRIGLAQVNPTVGDLKGNAALVRRWIGEAKKRGVQLLAFPELVLCGYPPEDLLLKPAFLRDCERELRALARSTSGIAVIVGAPEKPEKRGGPLYNTACLLYRGKVAARYRKINLPNYGVFDEKRYFTSGSSATVLDFAGTKIALNICEDVWVDDGPIGCQAGAGGAGIAVNISASPYHRRKGPEREKLMQRRARENDVWLCYINLLGGQDEILFDGSSVICSPRGETVARAAPFSEEMIIADIPVRGRLKAAGPGSSCSDITVETITLPALPKRKGIPLPRKRKADHLAPVEEIYRALVMGTRDYIEKNGFEGVVLGLSGGIDSALTATVAVDAVGPERVHGVTMPSGFTSKGTLGDVYRLAYSLGIDIYEYPISDIFGSYRELLSPVVPKKEIGVTEENIQARIRGNILMALSNRFGWLVLATGNKSEIAVGYCTLYGDMVGGFAVLKDVPKTMVYSLSRWRNRFAGSALIPLSTIRRKPSAELKPGQADEDSLPPYPVLDRIIELYVEGDLSPREIVAEGIGRATVARTIRMIDMNEYKRRQGPPGIKITPKAFGRDRRLPITNRYRPGGR
jgi:NAD+ synthase (glutamine-hydrolysing)